ncbi:4563_t:CDS:2 [Gigaspora margarita]|uniref:4563_t:CDS:1 n=1 Tax=Gigaspora margarita TaxID=4874 RepID=A0ABN7UAL1_GIGMA|nr:4563_t:CDS:2 [Gigaspora margarita]
MRQNVLHYHNLVFVIKFRWEEFYNLNSNRNFHTSESTKPSLYPNIKNLNVESKRLISQILYPTLQTLLSKFPSLSISIRDSKSPNPFFLQLDEIYLTSLIKFVPLSSENDLEKLIERQHDLKFNIDDETKPLWRIAVGVMNLQKTSERPEYDFCILFCLHHSIIDEISSLSLNNTFIKVLNETLKKYNSNTSTRLKKIPDSYTHAILPIQKVNQHCELIERKIDVRPTLCHFIKKGIGEFLKNFLFREHNYRIVDMNPRNTHHFHNRVKLVSLTEEEVKNIKTIAKDLTFPKSPTIFPFQSTISNNFIKSNNTNFYFWNLCHKYQSQINSDSSKFNNRMGLWDLFSKDKILKQMINCQKKLVGDGKICSILYSNLDQLNSILNSSDDIVETSRTTTIPSINHLTHSFSRIYNSDSLVNINLDEPNSNGWKLVDVIFSQSMYLVGPSLIVNSISQGQKMNLCIVYRVGSVSEQNVDSFAEGILKCLRIVGEDGEIELDQEI